MPDAAPRPPLPNGRVPLLERDDLSPAQRTRIGRAASALLSVLLVSTAAFSVFVIWHLIRRGRLIRQNLKPPKPVRPLESSHLPLSNNHNLPS